MDGTLTGRIDSLEKKIQNQREELRRKEAQNNELALCSLKWQQQSENLQKEVYGLEQKINDFHKSGREWKTEDEISLENRCQNYTELLSKIAVELSTSGLMPPCLPEETQNFTAGIRALHAKIHRLENIKRMKGECDKRQKAIIKAFQESEKIQLSELRKRDEKIKKLKEFETSIYDVLRSKYGYNHIHFGSPSSFLEFIHSDWEEGTANVQLQSAIQKIVTKELEPGTICYTPTLLENLYQELTDLRTKTEALEMQLADLTAKTNFIKEIRNKLHEAILLEVIPKATVRIEGSTRREPLYSLIDLDKAFKILEK